MNLIQAHAASLFLLFEAMTQCPVVENSVRFPPGAPTGMAMSQANDSFSFSKTETRSGSSRRKPMRPALKSETPPSRAYAPVGGCTFYLLVRLAQNCVALTTGGRL